MKRKVFFVGLLSLTVAHALAMETGQPDQQLGFKNAGSFFHEGTQHVSVSPDGKLALSVASKSVALAQLNDLSAIRRCSVSDEAGGLQFGKFSEKSDQVALAREKGGFYILPIPKSDGDVLELSKQLFLKDKAWDSLLFISDDKVAAAYAGGVSIVSLTTGDTERTIEDSYVATCFVRNNVLYAVSTSTSGHAKRITLPDYSDLPDIDYGWMTSIGEHSVSVSTDKIATFLLLNQEESFVVRDIDGKNKAYIEVEAKRKVCDFQLSADSQFLACATSYKDGPDVRYYVGIYKKFGEKYGNDIELGSNTVIEPRSLLFSPDNRFLLVATIRRELIFFDTHTKKEVFKLERVKRGCFTRNGNKLLTVCIDNGGTVLVAEKCVIEQDVDEAGAQDDSGNGGDDSTCTIS